MYNVIFLGGVSNFFLSLIKIIFGYWGNSHALLADGFHSAADLLVDALVFFAARYGRHHPDEDHPYGHGRIETAGTLGLAFFLVMIGGGIVWDACQRFSNVQHTPAMYVLVVVLLSLVVKEFFYQWTMRVARQLKSALLQANAWHHRSDAASSLVVLIGVSGALLGFHYFDAIAAIVVGILIIKMAWSLAWSSLRELIDTGVPAAMLETIRLGIQSVEGVREIHQLRTRSMAGAIFVDVHILVDPYLTVSEGHFISQQVHLALVRQDTHIRDVTVHVDPEDDGIVTTNHFLPSRKILLGELEVHWKNLPGREMITDFRLHYLSGEIIAEVDLPLSWFLAEIQTKKMTAENFLSELISQYQIALIQLIHVKAVKLCFVKMLDKCK